jgi:acyl-CoA thioesterase FadM
LEAFRFEVDVSCEDTDFSGTVYHANYLRSSAAPARTGYVIAFARHAVSGLLVASGHVSAACVDSAHEPIPIPISELIRIRAEFHRTHERSSAQVR